MDGRALPFIALLTLVVLPGACAGATDQYDLLGSPGSSNSAHDAGVDVGTHVPPPTKDASVTVDTGVDIDTGSPEIDTGVPTQDAEVDETGPTQPGFLCPGSTCDAPDVCCATNTGTSSTPTYKCQSANKSCGTQNNPGSPITCGATADCSSGVCCGDNVNGFYTQVSCQPTCTGQPSGGGNLVQFCDPNVGDCPASLSCKASQVLSGYYICNP